MKTRHTVRLWLRALGALSCLCPALALGAPERDHTTYIVTLPGAQGDTLLRVEAVGGVVDHFDGKEVRAYVHQSKWQAFQDAGIPYRIIAMQPAENKEQNTYPSYAELGTILRAAADAHPDITRLVSLGLSVQGREIWAMEITDQPGVEEDEPEFAFLSTMHGDEKVGTVLCLDFLESLLDGYGADSDITRLVNETDLWLVPIMNPDGYEIGIRWNANNVDLNRAFPDYPTEYEGTLLTEAMYTDGLEPEVAHVMNWSAANRFVLLANYHGGALVVNYPYDRIPGVPTGSDAPTPDDELMRVLAATYANENPPMLASRAFPGGITNGSAWYSVSGGMQDWHYRFLGAIDLTLEVSNIKSPPSSTLASYWEDNRNAMFAYLSRVHEGIRGLVTDSVSGEALEARILVDDNPQPVFSDPDVGDYHRLLPPGRYTIHVDSEGYIPYTIGAVDVADGEAVRVDVSLSTGDVNGDGTTDARDLQLAINSLLGVSRLAAADVDGGGVTATDVQQIINRVLGRR